MKCLTSTFVLSFALCALGCGESDSKGGPQGTNDSAGGAGEQDAAESDTGEQVAPVPPLLDLYTFESATLYPESGAFDPVGRTFFVGSAKHGSVIEISASGEQSELSPPDDLASMGTLGMRVDAERRLLWVCAVHMPDAAGEIWVFDLETKARLASVTLRDLHPEASCNDMAVASTGHAYVTDRENPNIYRIEPQTWKAEIWATDPLLAGIVGMNGVAVTPDEAYLLVSVYMPAAIFRVTLGDPKEVIPKAVIPKEVVKVELDGDAFAGDEVLTGADGMRLTPQGLQVAMGDRLATLTPEDSSWSRAEVKTEPIRPGTSAVIAAEGELYGLKSDIVAFVLKTEPRLPFELYRIGAD